MKKIELYRLKGLYREDFVVEGYRFGGEENSACIVGALRGNEMQQLYICSQLIKVLKELEAHGAITHGHGISGCADGKQLFHECWQTVLGSG